jgi:hypothetical protein
LLFLKKAGGHACRWRSVGEGAAMNSIAKVALVAAIVFFVLLLLWGIWLQ